MTTMTEDEAKGKWCPFARVVSAQETKEALTIDGNQPPFNRFHIDNKTPHVPSGSLCIGRICMAWRTIPGEEVRTDDPRGVPGSQAGYDENIVGIKRRFLPVTGYCGLAGKP